MTRVGCASTTVVGPVRSLAGRVECSIQVEADERGVVHDSIQPPVVSADTDFGEAELAVGRDGRRILRLHREFHPFVCSVVTMFQARLKQTASYSGMAKRSNDGHPEYAPVRAFRNVDGSYVAPSDNFVVCQCTIHRPVVLDVFERKRSLRIKGGKCHPPQVDPLGSDQFDGLAPACDHILSDVTYVDRH